MFWEGGGFLNNLLKFLLVVLFVGGCMFLFIFILFEIDWFVRINGFLLVVFFIVILGENIFGVVLDWYWLVGVIIILYVDFLFVKFWVFLIFFWEEKLDVRVFFRLLVLVEFCCGSLCRFGDLLKFLLFGVRNLLVGFWFFLFWWLFVWFDFWNVMIRWC